MHRSRPFVKPRHLEVRRIPLALALLWLLAAPVSSCAELLTDLRLGGFLKSLNQHVEPPPGGGTGAGNFSANRLRLDVTGRLAESDLELSVEDLLLYTQPAGFVPLPRNSVNRVVDLERSWGGGEHWADQLYVDRLNVRMTAFDVEWTLGRQAIGFGRMTLVSPLDIIAPFPPEALDTDVRPGVDALRAVRYFGVGGQLGAVAVLGDRSKHNSYLATFSYSTGGVDVLALAGVLRERPTGGLGLAGSVGGVGVKGELAVYGGEDVDEPGGDLHHIFAIGGVELWYRFANDVILLTEYLYNGAGEQDPEDYPLVANSAPFREGLSYLLGQHYLLAGPSYEVHPLVNLSGLLIWNLGDGSAFLRPLAEFSLSDNLDLQTFASFNLGEHPRDGPAPLQQIPRSEFGSFGHGWGFYLRYFF